MKMNLNFLKTKRILTGALAALLTMSIGQCAGENTLGFQEIQVHFHSLYVLSK